MISRGKRHRSETIGALLLLFLAKVSTRIPETYYSQIQTCWIDPPKGSLARIMAIHSLNVPVQDFTTDFYFRQYWKDPRLTFAPLPGVERIMVSTEYLKNIWVPDTFFANEKASYFHMATTSNEFLRISNNGEINRSIR